MDLVTVKLTEFGEKYLESTGGGPLRVHEGPHEFVFRSGETQRVTRSIDWEKVLSRLQVAGIPLFEIVDESAPAEQPAAQAE